PQTFENETSSLQGQYEGIGAYVDTDGEYLTIVSPIEGSPAEKAGLKPQPAECPRQTDREES
ncbi:MAG TPA: hypothetical protein VHP14_05280, partial [Anaerolineales bacterium]|nr:hypothetical protein [Anaerolineales bacterium]